MRLLVGGCFVLLGFLGVFLFRFVQTKNAPPFTPQASSFTLEPPAQAITATLSVATGVVQHFTREADAYQEATPAGIIRQGESIATQNGTATITLGKLGTISIGKNAEISFINLIPDALMFLHKAGTIEYKTNASIRAQHALVELQGDATISMDDSIAKVNVTRGTAKLALVDLQNNTNVWDIAEGQLAQINGETRVVVLR